MLWLQVLADYFCELNVSQKLRDVNIDLVQGFMCVLRGGEAFPANNDEKSVIRVDQSQKALDLHPRLRLQDIRNENSFVERYIRIKLEPTCVKFGKSSVAEIFNVVT